MTCNACARGLKPGLLVAAIVFAIGCHSPSPTQPSLVTPPRVEDTPAPLPVPVVPPLTMTLSQGRQDPLAGDGLSLTAQVFGPTAMPVTYTWTFGDASASHTTTTNFTGHTYARGGAYAATVTVLDGVGRTAHATRTVNVENRPTPPRPTPPPPEPPPTPPPAPVLIVTLTCTAKPAGGVTPTPTPCNVTTSYAGATLPSARVRSVRWDWGDGLTTETAGPSTSHHYQLPGSYTVFVDVSATTKAGDHQAATSIAITVP